MLLRIVFFNLVVCTHTCLFPVCVCVCTCVRVGGLVVKRGCQSSCQTDSHSSLLCNSLISLLSLGDTHTLDMQISHMTAYILARTVLNAHTHKHALECGVAARRETERQPRRYHRAQLIAADCLRGHFIDSGLLPSKTNGPRLCQESVQILVSPKAEASFVFPIWTLFFFFYVEVGKDTRARIPRLDP